jgi:hypothetical protein
MPLANFRAAYLLEWSEGSHSFRKEDPAVGRRNRFAARKDQGMAQYQVEVLPSGVGMAPLLQQQDAVKGQPRWTTPDDNMP